MEVLINVNVFCFSPFSITAQGLIGAGDVLGSRRLPDIINGRQYNVS